MPVPILILKRATKLNCQVTELTSAQFTLKERRELRGVLASCISDCEKIYGDLEQAESLRDVWRRCVALGDPPPPHPVPRELQDRQRIMRAILCEEELPPEVADRWPQAAAAVGIARALGLTFLDDDEYDAIKEADSANPSDQKILTLKREHLFDKIPRSDTLEDL